MKPTIVTIIGARPQFIKASMVSRALQGSKIKEIIINTGQHYDHNMANIFLKEMGIPEPQVNLGVGSGTNGEQTAKGLTGIENILIDRNPDCVLVYGDTNATLAGALAASKLNIPIAHVEAGLRSYNRTMPEEVNRVITDVISTYLFCPTNISVANLVNEAIDENVFLVGDVMYDALSFFTKLAENKSKILTRLNLKSKTYSLLTVHRPVNTDDNNHLQEIFSALGSTLKDFVFPIHPRTKKQIENLGIVPAKNIRLIAPVGYLDMMILEKYAQFIITDSGGIQKEAYLHRVPCITLRGETEWVETVDDGWNTLETDFHKLPYLINKIVPPREWKSHYGTGNAADKIAKILFSLF